MNKYEIPIVRYHSINDWHDVNPLSHLSFTREEFTQHLYFFKTAGYKLVTLSDLWNMSIAGEIGSSLTAILTFDDGFLDNYLLAEEILDYFNAKATIFVNPGHASSGPVRNLNDFPNAWGNLNFDEMRIMEKSGTFDIQSHTMTHDFIFVSDHLIDYYSPNKFDKYYWLVWMLHPYTKKEWHGDVDRFVDLVPSGYPIFKYGRALEGQKFIPSQGFVDMCVNRFNYEGTIAINEFQTMPDKGEYESEKSYLSRVDDQLLQSKLVLENELSKNIHFICFPGGVYSPRILHAAMSFGYKAYIRSSKDAKGSNLDPLYNATEAKHSKQIIGLNRIGFTHKYPKILPVKTSAYWSAKLSVGNFIEHPILQRGMMLGKLCRNISYHFAHR